MNDVLHRLQYLFDRYTNNSVTASERQELLDIIRLAEHEEAVKKLIEQEIEIVDNAQMNIDHILSEWRSGEIFRAILNLKQEADVVSLEEKPINKKRRWVWAAAAAILIMLGTSTYFVLNHRTPKNDLVKTNVPVTNDVKAPTTTNAVITLSNGKQIILDSAGAGILAVQGNTNVVKLADGQIVYNGKAEGEIQYNILTVPKGSRIASITLADGSKVWLNSESSLKYPVAFIGNERKVEITGEAYFEVAHNATMPFKVQKGELQVTVLGTHFNVNAYDDEAAIKVTLLEGSVKINKGNAATGFLKPGQQARVSSDIKIGDDVNMEEVMAWKNGKFQFGEAADIVTIMRQVSRWYDVDVEYKGTINGHIGGTISRNVNASQVFKMLEMTGVVTFQIDGKKVIVMPK